MKRFIIGSALLFAVASLQAAPVHLKSADGSNLSALCIAAASSERPLVEIAKSYGLNRKEVLEIRCNGMPVLDFVSRYRKNIGKVTLSFN